MNSLINALSANFTKWPNTLKQFVGKLPTNCLSEVEHFAGLTLKGLTNEYVTWFYDDKWWVGFIKKLTC